MGDTPNQIIGLATELKSDRNIETTTCQNCRGNTGTSQTCGACGKYRDSGERIHCVNRRLELIEEQQDEGQRLKRGYGDCTTCLGRGHDTDAEREEKQNEATTCGTQMCPRIKATGTACIQNTVFHEPTSHNARNRSRYSQGRGITQLAFIIALGLLLKGIQVIPQAQAGYSPTQWQPDKN